MTLFDTHAHYDHERFDGDRDAVLAGLSDYCYVVNVGSDLASSERSIELARKYPFVWAAAGIHPHCASAAPEDFEAAFTALFADVRVVAVGEIGLDYHYDFSPRERQKEVFARQLALAGRLKKPVVIHDREAHADVLDIARAHRDDFCGGEFHSFSGDRALLRDALDLGYYIAFGGMLTFKKSFALAEAAVYVPPDRLLIETDCPYLAPEPYRGQRTDAPRVGLVAARLAELRRADAEEIARLTCENA
ncbi:MAG: TatD family hydrolase, partial [Clostridiales bacterium]|nr:TatD family hydrolase [Clostridiales bacterium]